LHSHHQLAEAFGINRIHFTEKKRNETSRNCLKDWKERGFKLSTSIHSMSDFEKSNVFFDYAFFGPFSKVFLNQYVSDIDFEKN
jgi:thiamine-phosphate pyrophosphorylase